jgi:hypothetical protein
MSSSSEKLFKNKRKEPRKPYSGLISFVYKKQLYPGKLINYSLCGLFIKAKEKNQESPILDLFPLFIKNSYIQANS